jgi:hypothetical protein
MRGSLSRLSPEASNARDVCDANYLGVYRFQALVWADIARIIPARLSIESVTDGYPKPGKSDIL